MTTGPNEIIATSTLSLANVSCSTDFLKTAIPSFNCLIGSPDMEPELSNNKTTGQRGS